MYHCTECFIRQTGRFPIQLRSLASHVKALCLLEGRAMALGLPKLLYHFPAVGKAPYFQLELVFTWFEIKISVQ